MDHITNDQKGIANKIQITGTSGTDLSQYRFILLNTHEDILRNSGAVFEAGFIDDPMRNNGFSGKYLEFDWNRKTTARQEKIFRLHNGGSAVLMQSNISGRESEDPKSAPDTP